QAEQFVPALGRGLGRDRAEPEAERQSFAGREPRRTPEVARRPDADTIALHADLKRVTAPGGGVEGARRHLLDVLEDDGRIDAERRGQLVDRRAVLAEADGEEVEDPVEPALGRTQFTHHRLPGRRPRWCWPYLAPARPARWAPGPRPRPPARGSTARTGRPERPRRP